MEQYGHFKALTLLTLRFIFDLHEITAEITNCICRSKKNPYYEIQVETHSKTNHHNMHYWSHYLYVDSVLHIKIGLNFSIQILYPTTNLTFIPNNKSSCLQPNSNKNIYKFFNLQIMIPCYISNNNYKLQFFLVVHNIALSSTKCASSLFSHHAQQFFNPKFVHLKCSKRIIC